MGKSTISTGPFSIAMLVHQRVPHVLPPQYIESDDQASSYLGYKHQFSDNPYPSQAFETFALGSIVSLPLLFHRPCFSCMTVWKIAESRGKKGAVVMFQPESYRIQVFGLDAQSTVNLTPKPEDHIHIVLKYISLSLIHQTYP